MLALLLALGTFQRFPILQYLLGAIGIHSACSIGKYMWMPALQLSADTVNHIIKLKMAIFFGQLGIKHHLKQQITQFIF